MLRSTTIALVIAFLTATSAGRPPRATARAQQESPLAAMRKALGDKALASVKTFTLTGTITRHAGPQTSSIDLEVDAELPDRFVEITKEWRVVSPQLPSYHVTTYNGVNGGDPIHVTVAPDAPVLQRPGPPSGGASAPSMAGFHLAVAWLMPRLGTIPDAYHMDLIDDGQKPVLRLAGLDDYAVTLELDPATHLPAVLRWMAPPTVVVSSASRGPIDVSPVEWTTAFSDFQALGGVLWPRHLTTSFNHAVYEDCKIAKTKINQPIDPRVFQPGK